MIILDSQDHTLAKLRAATIGTVYEKSLFLVGGCVRDRIMGLTTKQDDIDIVLEGDALELAAFLHAGGWTEHHPVVYPRFGTAMIVVDGRNVELVGARTESYASDSRKPTAVRPGTLMSDALRRDFTINTLLQNLQTGEIIDPLGLAHDDISGKIIRTPTEASLTFKDDPLRMLRAIRFAARFEFEIAPETWAAILASSERISIVSGERIRDEFVKIILSPNATHGMRLLQESELLKQFAHELAEMVGVNQNEFHDLDVWEHTLAVLTNLPQDADLTVRLAALLHDVGKPATRSVGTGDHVHFYNHQIIGAEMTRDFLARLKFSNDDIRIISALVQHHMRIGEYNADWTDGAVRRLIRDFGTDLDNLFTIHRADVMALAPKYRDLTRSIALLGRIDLVNATQKATTLQSPLNGTEIMSKLKIESGRTIGEIKHFLTDEVIEGRLASGDKDAALILASAKLASLRGVETEL